MILGFCVLTYLYIHIVVSFSLILGDIISIYRKVNSDWWYGEVNNKKGLFPVNHIEEF